MCLFGWNTKELGDRGWVGTEGRVPGRERRDDCPSIAAVIPGTSCTLMSEATALTAAEGASPWLLHLLKIWQVSQSSEAHRKAQQLEGVRPHPSD